MAKEKIAKDNAYGDNSIRTRTDLTAVRENPNIYLGTAGIDGVKQGVFEIISNSVDEAREGYGDVVNVTLFKDGSVEVDDFGRGVPLGYNENEKDYNWNLVFCRLNAGGKYDRNTSEGSYTTSLGTHGIGASATQFTSEYMIVKSFRNGVCGEVSFKAGVIDGEYTERPTERGERKSGTVIKWKPDIKVFTDINLIPEHFFDMMKRQAFINAGIKFVFKYEKESGKFEKVEYLYENGITDYIKALAGDTAKTDVVQWSAQARGRDREDKPEYDLYMNMVFCCSDKVNVIEYYHNSSHLSRGGSPSKAVSAAFISCFDKYMKNTGKYNKDESKINFNDVASSLILITNCFSTNASFEHQTKEALENPFIEKAMTEWIKTNLEIYFTENPDEADIIADTILINKRSRETVNNEIIGIKKSLTKMMDTSNKVEKFVGCRSKDKKIRELYIVEGDSALGSCKHARNSEFQALIPVKGKTLNCMKSSYDKIFGNDVIMDLLRVIGCGVEITHKKMKDLQNFNLENLKWDKIIICTDADEDGYQIRTLILTMFHTLLPTLIKEGKVYIVESPLYEIIVKDKSMYAYDEKEKAEIIAGLGKTKYIIQRSKGLGENSADMMALTTMNPATRRLIKVLPSTPEETEHMFEMLLGDALVERKKFIIENGHKYYNYTDL